MLISISPTPGPLDVMLRSLVIGQLGKYDHSDTVQESKKRFDNHVSGTEPLQADLKSAIFSTCLANGDENTFEQLMNVRTVDTLVPWEMSFIGRWSFIQRLNLSIKDTLGPWELSFIGRWSFTQRLNNTVEPFNKGHTGTLGTVLYREVVLYSEVK